MLRTHLHTLLGRFQKNLPVKKMNIFVFLIKQKSGTLQFRGGGGPIYPPSCWDGGPGPSPPPDILGGGCQAGRVEEGQGSRVDGRVAIR